MSSRFGACADPYCTSAACATHQPLNYDAFHDATSANRPVATGLNDNTGLTFEEATTGAHPHAPPRVNAPDNKNRRHVAAPVTTTTTTTTRTQVFPATVAKPATAPVRQAEVVRPQTEVLMPVETRHIVQPVQAAPPVQQIASEWDNTRTTIPHPVLDRPTTGPNLDETIRLPSEQRGTAVPIVLGERPAGTEREVTVALPQQDRGSSIPIAMGTLPEGKEREATVALPQQERLGVGIPIAMGNLPEGKERDATVALPQQERLGVGIPFVMETRPEGGERDATVTLPGETEYIGPTNPQVMEELPKGTERDSTVRMFTEEYAGPSKPIVLGEVPLGGSNRDATVRVPGQDISTGPTIPQVTEDRPKSDILDSTVRLGGGEERVGPAEPIAFGTPAASNRDTTVRMGGGEQQLGTGVPVVVGAPAASNRDEMIRMPATQSVPLAPAPKTTPLVKETTTTTTTTPTGKLTQPTATAATTSITPTEGHMGTNRLMTNLNPLIPTSPQSASASAPAPSSSLNAVQPANVNVVTPAEKASYDQHHKSSDKAAGTKKSGGKVKGAFHEAIGSIKESAGKTFHNPKLQEAGHQEKILGQQEKSMAADKTSRP